MNVTYWEGAIANIVSFPFFGAVTFPNLGEGVLCFNSQIVLLENSKVSKVSGIPAFFRVKSQVIKLCLLPMVQSLCVFPELWSPVAMCVGFRHPLLGLSKLRLVLFAPWRFLHHNLPGCFRLPTHSTSSTSPWSRATNLLGENCPFYAFFICTRSILILFYVQNLHRNTSTQVFWCCCWSKLELGQGEALRLGEETFASDADFFSVSTNERAAIQMNRTNQGPALNNHLLSCLTSKGAINDQDKQHAVHSCCCSG